MYFQDDQNGENYGPSQPYYTQSRDYSSGPPGREYPSSPPGRDYRTPPPAHQELARVPGQYRQERQNQNTEIKEEPGLDMSQWSHPGYQVWYELFNLISQCSLSGVLPPQASTSFSWLLSCIQPRHK